MPTLPAAASRRCPASLLRGLPGALRALAPAAPVLGRSGRWQPRLPGVGARRLSAQEGPFQSLSLKNEKLRSGSFCLILVASSRRWGGGALRAPRAGLRVLLSQLPWETLGSWALRSRLVGPRLLPVGCGLSRGAPPPPCPGPARGTEAASRVGTRESPPRTRPSHCSVTSGLSFLPYRSTGFPLLFESFKDNLPFIEISINTRLYTVVFYSSDNLPSHSYVAFLISGLFQCIFSLSSSFLQFCCLVGLPIELFPAYFYCFYCVSTFAFLKSSSHILT